MKNNSLLALTLFTSALLQTPAFADSRPDSHSPIGVMADHKHNAGEWMLSYRYMQMQMAGQLQGTSSISSENVLNSYMVSPEDMEMTMHMFGAMYAPTQDITLMLMLPYIEKSMTHQTRMNMTFETDSSDIGDIRISVLQTLWNTNDSDAHIEYGLALPTGEIDAKDQTPAGYNRLPYPMQIGSGTYDLILGMTTNYRTEDFSVGGQVRGIYRLGENDNDYTLGNQFQLTGWLARQIHHQWSISTRLSFVDVANIDGADPTLNPMMIPTADANLRAGQTLNVGLGVNFITHSGHRIGLEWKTPLWQDLEGPQLKTDWQVTLGWQYAF